MYIHSDKEVRWDPAKARRNLRKHGVAFTDAEAVLFDPVAVTLEDPDARGERRYVTIGTDACHRVLVVVHADFPDVIRLISARRATRSERRSYEEGIRFQ